MKISWTDYYTYTDELIDKIKKSGYRPNVIVSIHGSGKIPAHAVANALSITDVRNIKISSYDSNNEKGEAQLLENNLGDLDGLAILVADDIVATGDTMRLARSTIQSQNISQLRFAAPVISEYVCKEYPEYWGRSILRDKDDFISLPWD